MGILYGIGAIIASLFALAVFFGPIVYAWTVEQCPKGGVHDDETIESSQVPPFATKHRCTKCGRVTTNVTYAL